jgi:GxxExxY protein
MSALCSESLTFAAFELLPRLRLQSSIRTAMLENLADILVEDQLVIELKCVDHFASEHIAQCLNYLKVSGRTLCLLINFQKPKVQWKRIVLGFQA